jgi:hypothetical protein
MDLISEERKLERMKRFGIKQLVQSSGVNALSIPKGLSRENIDSDANLLKIEQRKKRFKTDDKYIQLPTSTASDLIPSSSVSNDRRNRFKRQRVLSREEEDKLLEIVEARKKRCERFGTVLVLTDEEQYVFEKRNAESVAEVSTNTVESAGATSENTTMEHASSSSSSSSSAENDEWKNITVNENNNVVNNEVSDSNNSNIPPAEQSLLPPYLSVVGLYCYYYYYYYFIFFFR